jgi:hypothetical protein
MAEGLLLKNTGATLPTHSASGIGKISSIEMG